MSTLTLAPQNILKSNKKEAARIARNEKAKQQENPQPRQPWKEAQELEDQENIKECLKGFFEYMKGKGAYKFLPGTDFKKGIILFEFYDDKIANGSVYIDEGENEADEW